MKRNAYILLVYVPVLLCYLIAEALNAQGCGCAPLPAPGNSQTVVTVSSISALQAEINNATGRKTIYLTSGTYNVGTTYVNVTKPNITIRSLTGNAADVVIQGTGMLSLSGSYHGIAILNTKCTIADLTIKDIDCHPIDINFWYQPNSIDSTLIHNVHIIDGGEQLIKMSYSGNPNQVGDNGIIECSTLEYTSSLPGSNWYTNGIDLHFAHNWIIRDNILRNIKAGPSATQSAGPAILFFKNGGNQLIERNKLIDCDEGIFLGNWGDNPNQSNSGGIIRNNFIRGHALSRCGIGVVLTPNAQVINNTIWSPGGTQWTVEQYSIEVTGSLCTNLLLQNNLMDEAPINNQNLAPPFTPVTCLTNAVAANFVNVNGTNPDLHIVSSSFAHNTGTNHPNRLNDVDCQGPNGIVDVGADEYNGITSDVASADVEISLKVYPNPFSSMLNLNFTLTEANKFDLELVNMMGEIIWKENIEISSGTSTQELDISSIRMADGVYSLRIQSSNYQHSFLVMKCN